MMDDMYGWMEQILRAAGAEVVPYRKYLEPIGDATHECGTARMGADPRTSVLNPWCQAHDVRNLFLTDASSFVSLPGTHGITTWIMSLAWRVVLPASGVLPERLALAQRQQHTARAATQPYRPQFFNASEYRLLDELAETILPADDHSPGARAARVADFIDLVVANSSAETQQRWRAQVAGFAASGFAAAGASERAALLKRSAEQKDAFFLAMREMTLRAYYTSEIGLRQELGYRGPEALAVFPGCKE